jgi:hypothetical protein
MAPMETRPVAAEAVPTTSGCPVPHVAAANACPFPHDAQAASAPVRRSRADVFVRRLLRVHERPPGVTSASAYSAFQKSMVISGIRCTLTYVVFPFVLPLLGLAAGVGPIVGIVIGTVAIVCDVFTIRRFFAVDHKWRWRFSAIALSVVVLLFVLLVEDFVDLFG